MAISECTGTPATSKTPRNPAGDIARLGALLAAIEGLACALEDHVAGGSPSGYYLVTAIQACVQSAKGHAADADAAIEAANAKGGAA